MSMDRCHRCDRLVDTDEDLECYDKQDYCVCEVCRDREEAAFQQAVDDAFDQQKGPTRED